MNNLKGTVSAAVMVAFFMSSIPVYAAGSSTANPAAPASSAADTASSTALGTTADTAWSSGVGTVVSLLKAAATYLSTLTTTGVSVTNGVTPSAAGTPATSGNTVEVQGNVSGVPLPGNGVLLINKITTTGTGRTYTTNTAISSTASTSAGAGFWSPTLARTNGGSVTLGTYTFSYQGSTSPITGAVYIFPSQPSIACTDNAAFNPTAADWALSPRIYPFFLNVPLAGGAATTIQQATIPIYDAITNYDGTAAKVVWICPVLVGAQVTAAAANVFTQALSVLNAN